MADIAKVNNVAAADIEKVNNTAKASIETVNGLTFAGAAYADEKCVQFAPGATAGDIPYMPLAFASTKDWPNGATGDAAYALFKQDNAWSVSIWVKSSTTTAVVGIPWGRYSGGATNAPGVNGSFGSDGDLYLFYRNAAGTYILNQTAATTVYDGNWHHVVWTYDGSGNEGGAKIYFDESLVSWASQAGSNIGTSSSTQVTSPFVLGNREVLTSRAQSYSYQGKMDEVSLWDVELSLSEVQEIYSSGDGTEDLNAHSQASNLVHWFRLGDHDDDEITATEPDWDDNNIADASTAAGYTRAIGTTNRKAEAQCQIVTDAP